MKHFLLAILLTAPVAGADERYDHRGAVGLLVQLVGDNKTSTVLKGGGDSGWRYGLDLGVSFAVGTDGNEVKGILRGLFGGIENGCSRLHSCAPVDLGLYLGYRGYFAIADSRWKTFFDLDLAQHVVPHFAIQNDGTQVYVIGPRIALGVQLDFLPIAGVNLMLEGELGFGDGLRFSGGLTLGFQLRSYLLE